MADLRPFALSIFILLPSGCARTGDVGGDASPAHDGQGAERAQAAVSVPLLPQSDVADTASLSGTLRVENGCLYVVTADGARVLPAFLTARTDWDTRAGRLAVGGRSFAAGDRVVLGGSMSAAGATSLRWIRPPAMSCDTARIWITGSIDQAR